jgi:hypothetical protein
LVVVVVVAMTRSRDSVGVNIKYIKVLLFDNRKNFSTSVSAAAAKQFQKTIKIPSHFALPAACYSCQAKRERVGKSKTIAFFEINHEWMDEARGEAKAE